MGLVTVVPTVIVAVTGPVFWDAAAAVTFKLDAGTRMTATRFITVIATVIVCRTRFFRLTQLLDCFTVARKVRKCQRMTTVIAAPVDVDATAVGTGELCQREAGWIG